MNQGSLKNATIVLIAGVLFAAAYALKKIMQAPVVQLETQELSYEMPRAKTELPPYSLSGRRVIRNLHSTPSAAKPVSQPAPIAQVNNAPVAAKKPDPRIASAQAAAKKAADAKKAAAAKAAAQKRKAQMSVVTNNAAKSQMSGFENSNYDQQENAGGYTPPPAPTADAGAEPHPEEKAKLSAGQWRSLLFNQPTPKNGQEFLAAYKAREVDDGAFYQISNELLTDNAADRQKLGLALLQATPSAKSFTTLLNHQEKAPEPMRAQIAALLDSYAAVPRFSILKQLLYSNDVRVVQKAQSLLQKTLASIRPNENNGQGQTGRDVRAPGSGLGPTSIPVAQFASFVPALQRLLTSNDAAVVQQAQELLERIRAMQPA